MAFSLLLSLFSLLPTYAQPVDPLPRRGTLGVSMAPVPADIAAKDKLKPGQGGVVTVAVPGLADKVGLLKDDIVLSLNGKAISPATVVSTLWTITPGKAVKIAIIRDGKPLELDPTLPEKPRDPGNDKYSVEYSSVLSNGHRMRTIISLPKSPGKHPALFFIQGYSPISYDYNLEGGVGLRLDAPILADFANNDFVTMRVEKPGVGDSEGGPFAAVDFTTELDIYRQALKQLKGLEGVDPENVFIFGHSMGGAFGPMVACEIPVKGMILYGVAARTWHEYLLDTLRYQSLLGGATYAAVDDGVRTGAHVFDLVFEDNKTPDQVKKEHPELAATVNAAFPGGLFNDKTHAFWRQLLATNFAAYLSKCNTHVFAVHGASDFVSYEVDHRLIADIVNSVHPGWGKWATAPSSDHLFNNWPTEADSVKHWPTGEFNPAFISMARDWARDVMDGKS